jgi:electron transport complex protein RnfE
MKLFLERMKNGLFTENPLFVQVLATCPALAVSTSMINAIGMGLSSTAVLVCSNILISMLRKFIPDKIRIPSYIVVIAGFVSAIDMIMEAFTPDLYVSLGIYIPLIVVNCVILGRAEAYANKNGIIASMWDGLGMGLGFTLALLVLGFFRELFGAGTLFGIQIMPSFYEPANIMILAPGAFLTLSMIMAFLNYRKLKLGNSSTDIHDVTAVGVGFDNPYNVKYQNREDAE